MQDGAVSRTKNGKSLRVRWFPIPTAFQRELESWLEELADLGATSEDTLFPSGDWLFGSWRARARAQRPVPPMTSTHAVSEAFKLASRMGEARYTPHAAKHTIAALRGTLSLTEAQRKAWSQNMGHETEQITETHMESCQRRIATRSSKK
ncbi:MAG: hypothetical protein AAF583_05625 [Pseudomonadota bacterium]